MPKSANQKLKLLYLMRFLMQNTDEEHSVTINDMIAELARYDIGAERKSLYDDIEALRLFGVDVERDQSGYFVASRDFELPELKLLVDSVQSSKFITQKKTLSLIKKIEGLTSIYSARLLQRQVYVSNRVKSMNESVYYNVDEVSAAISQDRMIRFRYYEYTVEKERRYRHDGAYYTLSPFALMWDDENYYMLAWDDAAGRMKHFRVDKMNSIILTDKERLGKDVFESTDMSGYSKKVFGMFTGEEQLVKLKFENSLCGAVIDRFGRDIMLIRSGDDHFTVTLKVVVSPQFFAWLASSFFQVSTQISLTILSKILLRPLTGHSESLSCIISLHKSYCCLKLYVYSLFATSTRI